MASLHFPRRLPEPSRRQLVLGAALVGGVGLVAGAAVGAPTKLSQADSGYQGHPNNAQRCELCANWRAPTSCNLVSGVISSNGWCSLYARKT
jgi:hypothetical protein